MRNSIYELVETSGALPFDVSLHSVNYVPSHWHNSLEVIFVLRGTLEVTVDSRQHSLTEGDVLVINSSHVHEVIGLDLNIIATFLIPDTYIKANLKDSVYFDCDSRSAGKEQRQGLDRIRQLLAEMVHLRYKQGEVYELEMQIRMLSVLSTFARQFRTEAQSGAMNEKYKERMLRIITYIDEHYEEPLSLQDIADREFLSVPYLSKFFSDNIGLNFQSYLTSIRLKNAVEELLSCDEERISDLALKHGFPNAKSFYSAFKNRYHMTPNEYRKQYRPGLGERQDKPSSNYLAFNQSSALGIISQYLQRSKSYEQPQVQALATTVEEVDMSTNGTMVRHTWKNVITIGKAKEGLHADVQEHLRYVQKHCPFRSIRFHGILDDEMMVYREDDAGKPHYNFRFVDQLFDFLLSIGLKPFVELGFMPSDMASDPEKKVFFKPSYVSGPKSMERWCELVERLLRHCMNRYGAYEVESWKLEFWNEPEFDVFWPGSIQEYMDFYLQTYRTVKQVSQRLQMGAPGRIITLRSETFNREFFSFCRENDCLPDFIPVHFYPHEQLDEMVNMEEITRLYKLEPYRALLEEFGGISPNPNYLKDMLENEKSMLMDLELSHLPLYLTEWNSTAYHRELTNDTLYKAAYIVKNIVGNLDRIEGFGYWVLSDNIEETHASELLFHGGLGLIAQYGIPKPAMLGYEFLAKLGDRLLACGERYVVTAGRDSYQVLCYNYCHFDDLYALGDISFIDEKNRYNGFKEEKTVKLELELQNMPKGRYRMVTHTVSRTFGSSYDEWVRMGAPDYLNPEEITYLKASARPRMKVRQIDIEDSTAYTAILEPHSIELIELFALE
ncbi:helix-turn-helix domain-containing protein [Paenibacillus dokdonensis]|uniref:Helix-turn-helix domain-containing protein n=1 Tax=Paenibacillus dokdonensis TaxID=2567944 RepID=A0ABU6GXL4_9BACL|nr:helix-turn-helix domain-containing protein [Paenibacillus dokdonensis]MEC0243161.1 helix-turn-helix domain-containing protein [Paenibacillus dokdonensis]